MFKTKQLLNVFKPWCEWGISERFYFHHVLRGSRDGSVTKPWSMLNIAIFDPWQRSLFSRQRTPGKEPLLTGKVSRELTLQKRVLFVVVQVEEFVLKSNGANADTFQNEQRK